MLPILAWLAIAGATPVFTNPTPTSLPAARRSSDCAVRADVSGITDEFITYGGFNGAVLQDVPFYRVLTNTWGAPLTAVLPARERHAMAYDLESGFIAIVGGGNGLGVFDTVTFIDPTNAVTTPAPPVTAPRPSARIDASLVWVPPLRRFVYFGGSANVFGTTHMNDLWELDVTDGGVNWSLPPSVIVTPPPSPRGAACLVYDPEHKQLVLFGGETNGPAYVNDTWTYALDGGGWAEVAATGALPSVRAFAGCEWDRTQRQVVVYGGQAPGGPMGGLYTYNPATRLWVSHPTTTNPGNLSDTATCYSPQAKGVVFFGGRSAASTYVNTTWVLRFNEPPTVDAGPNQAVGEGATVTLTGSAVDPEMDALTPTWVQFSGPPVTLVGTGFTRTFTAPAVALTTTFGFNLLVSDGVNPAVIDDVNVTVANTLNEVPMAFAGMDQTVDAGVTVTLVGSGVDPNNDPLTYQWSQVAGPAVVLTSTGAIASFAAPSPSVTTVLAFRLTVSDPMAQSLPDDVFVTVNAAPSIDAGVDAGVADAGVADAGVADAGVADAGVADAGVADAGVADAGVADAGVADAGVADAGVADAGVADAGAVDAGDADAGNPDAGLGLDAGMMADGGSTDPKAFGVGCGCQQGTPSALWLLGLVVLAWNRRRRA